MPIATVSMDDLRFELKSLEGAFVTLKPMTFGQKQHRMELVMGDARMKQNKNKEADQEVAVAIMQRIVTEYEFKHCIVTHNLEVEEGVPMDFNQGKALDLLHPKIGDEIAKLIESMNNFEEAEEGDSKN